MRSPLALSLALLASPALADEAPQDASMHMHHTHAVTDQAGNPSQGESDPPNAADAIWGREAMQASREAMMHEMSARPLTWFLADRLEYSGRSGRDGYLWDVDAFYGGDVDKLWFKSEGQGSFGERVEQAEVQALWSHAIGPWIDLQTGLRQDFAGPDRTHAVVGIQGLAPYGFEIEASAFLSHKGELTGRAKAELDQHITQRLVVQPRVELNLAAQDTPELGVGAGLDQAELGIRLRYELAREFAPYVGIEQEWRTGRSADFARARGDRPNNTNFVAGIRFWF